MIISTGTFRGIRPKLAPHLLEQNEAQIAQNCKLYAGELRPWFNSSSAAVLKLTVSLQTIYYYLSAHWFEFSADVDIAEGPIASDTTYRRYYTGDGIPKKTNQTEATTGATDKPINFYPLQVPIPTGALTATVGSNGVTWTSRTSAADNNWNSVAYGNGLFVAVAYSGSGNRVMTSPDGITWTSRTSAVDNDWYSVTYGNGLFVAVSVTGTGNRVMTSPDGVTWTSRTSAADNNWFTVTYGNGLFVAVAYSGTGNRVMTSPDGVTWTSRTSAADNDWRGVVYGNGLFVAVSVTGSGNRVMTSPDGITWTLRTSAVDNNWLCVTYGNGLFVAVSNTGTGNRVMTSPDGTTWTSRTSASDNNWIGVTYGNGLFVAVAITGSGNRVMTSPDGITWTSRTSAVDNDWRGVVYGDGLFVAVSVTGSGNRVMTSESSRSGGTGDDRDVTYIWTVVTSWGEEGPPSPAATIVEAKNGEAVSLIGMTLAWQAGTAYTTDHWVIPTVLGDYVYKCVVAGTSGGSEPSPWGTTIDGNTTDGTVTWRCYDKGILYDAGGGKRIYRSAVGYDSASYRYLTQIAITATTYTDSTADTDLGEVITVDDYISPPDGLIGLVGISNGIMAAFTGKDLYFTEPYYPHAYTLDYLSLDNTIVGLGVIGSSIIALTESQPYIIQGSSPDSMTPNKLPDVAPCKSKRSIVSCRFGVMYATANGLYLIDGTQGKLITEGILTKNEWDLYYPATMHSTFHDNKYIGFYKSGANEGGIIYDLVEGTFTTLDFYATAVYTNPKTDEFYYVLEETV